MTKKQQDFEMWSGDHKDVTYTVSDSTGASVNLTGASVSWLLASQAGSGSLLKLTADSGCGITISGCTFTVSLSPTHTSGLGGLYYSEAQVRDTGSNVSTVAIGTVDIHTDLAV